jgi:hypothetical protein
VSTYIPRDVLFSSLGLLTFCGKLNILVRGVLSRKMYFYDETPVRPAED